MDSSEDKSESKHVLADFFEAKSVVIIGASKKTQSPGNIVARNFIDSDFDGDLFFINPRQGRLFTKPLLNSVMDLPWTVDLGIVVVPASIVPKVAEECGKRGVKRLVILSGGFGETGEEGKRLEEQLLETCRKYDIRFIGPNCLGLYVPKNKIDTIFLQRDKVQRPSTGPMSFFTQSGAFGAAFLSEMFHLGFGRWISKFVSFGNAVDINEADILEYLGQDEDTKVILGYLEGFKEARRFLEAAKKACTKKPFILIKGNRTEAGAHAASSHTASVATNDHIVDDLLRDAGIIRVDDWEEMLNAAKMFTQPMPEGDRVAVISNGGGVAVMISDAIGLEKLRLAKFKKETVTRLEELLPRLYVKTNPVDLTGSSTNEQYFASLNVVKDDPNVDAIILVVLTAPPYIDPRDFADRMVSLIRNETWVKDKPFIILTMGGEEAMVFGTKMERLGIPTYYQPTAAVRALSRLVQYSKFLKRMIGQN
ncbi:MAG: acetate--CoA ligase family protein [Candidatus Hodarchaeales archaeon]